MKKNRIYDVIEFTPVADGYRRVPYRGMQPKIKRQVVTRTMCAAKSAAHITAVHVPEGRVREAKFVGWAESVEAWKMDDAHADAIGENVRRDLIERDIDALVEMGMRPIHARCVRECVYHRRQGKGRYYFALERGGHEGGGLLLTRPDGTRPDNAPMYRLSSWLKFWGYRGDIRSRVIEQWALPTYKLGRIS